jgi:hypothetical protein
MFNGYAAASPAIGWDNGVLSKFEKEFAEKKLDTPKRIYMTVGDVELGKPGFEQFAALMTSRHYPSIILQSKVLENTGHSGTKSETYARGLQFVFEKPKVKLNANILNRYTGHYEGPGGLQFDLRMDNGQFTFFYSPTAKIPLLAASENHFYSNSQFFNLYFTGVDANAITVRFERYNNIQHFKKIN